ncbi:serine kinase [Tyzzerella sp. An114]|mgnify:CR=1 FL=1|uniref:HPr family phosphocarrier protein n=1 Tax=Tyzzerella sp. An114 TaxID=1965545 RepID=UPI000B43A16A|nr:HPr family phosphocarrier protein [Tyzzerella sp. An114]OUQ58725.1 serine kinase [Tyzzerella sp. An114]HIT73250.1 HPr family phosphocarrier protein [Candidatus Fimicola cottocaccae]
MEKTICLKTISDVKNFVNIVTTCSYDVDLISDKYVIDAKSIMGIFSLDLSKPLKMVLNSEDCDDILEKLKDFICE